VTGHRTSATIGASFVTIAPLAWNQTRSAGSARRYVA
jgi:hypothetical protein